MALISLENQTYTALLGLAEYFKQEDPPDIKSCIHCLQSILATNPTPQIEVKTYLQLGQLLSKYTNNYDYTKFYLEKAIMESEKLPNSQNIQMQSVNMLAKLLIKKKEYSQAVMMMQKIMIQCQRCLPRWQYRNLFLLAQVQILNKDYSSALELLDRGAETSNSQYLRCMFLLTKAMILLIQRRFEEFSAAIVICEKLNDHSNEFLHETLKVFSHILQVHLHLITGKAKTVKPILRSLQHCVQSLNGSTANTNELTSENNQDQGHDIIWMSIDNLCIVVYLITVMHSVLIGQMEKAQKYTDKALNHIERLRSIQHGDEHLLSAFEIMLFENTTICHLIMGNKELAIEKIGAIAGICSKNEQLAISHTAQLHTQLGLYSMSMNCTEQAEMQFKKALEVTMDSELWVFINLNLAILYLRANRHNDLAPLLQSLSVANLNNSQSLIAAHTYVKGLNCFFTAQYCEAKRFLKDSLSISNTEDLKRLTALTLILLGNIVMSSGNLQDALNLIQPGLSLSFKIPDIHVKLWASSLLKDIYSRLGDHMEQQKSNLTYEECSKLLLSDHYKAAAVKDHSLIQWIEGLSPPGIS